MAKHKAETEAAKSARLADVDQRLQAAAAEADLQRRHLAAAQSEIGRLTAFWHYFKRRRRQKSLEVLRNHVVVADAAVGDLHAERSAIEREAGREFPGISLAARRNINLAIISFAELLCENVDAYGLAARAKEAVARRVHEMNFGTRADCEGYMQRVQKAHAAVANQKQITGRAQSQAGPPACNVRIPQQRRHRADRRFAGAVGRGRSTSATTPSRPRALLERAGRGLLGSVHAAAALKTPRALSRRAPACRCGAPASGPPGAPRVTARSAAICEASSSRIPADGVVLDLLERLRRLDVVRGTPDILPLETLAFQRVCVPPRAS